MKVYPARVGRPTKGLGHVDDVEGSAEAKERAKVLIEVVAGTLSFVEGARRLSVSTTRLEQLRVQALQGTVAALEARAPGRPRKHEPGEEAPRIDLARARAELAWEREVARVREEIALLCPNLVARGPGTGAPGKAKSSRSGRPKPGARTDTSGRAKA